MSRLRWLLGCGLAVAVQAQPATWRETTWQEERAVTSSSAGWTAIVSLDRGRLVHFGPAETDRNLLYAPVTRDHPHGWGGHRVWLGPQTDWSRGWPPPAGWERSGVDAYHVSSGVLELPARAAGEGWASYHRTYHWQGESLVCGVQVQADSTRPAQVIQILQVPATTRVTARAHPSLKHPQGYVGLAAGERSAFEANPAPDPGFERDGDTVTLTHTGEIVKLGFRPQPWRAELDGYRLVLAVQTREGQAVGEPDAGFHTQVYLGGAEPFIELEQLSPLWRASTVARFAVVITAFSD